MSSDNKGRTRELGDRSFAVMNLRSDGFGRVAWCGSGTVFGPGPSFISYSGHDSCRARVEGALPSSPVILHPWQYFLVGNKNVPSPCGISSWSAEVSWGYPAGWNWRGVSQQLLAG